MTKNHLIFFASLVSASVAYGSTNMYDYDMISEKAAFRQSEIQCLTQNIYHEARGEEVLGQIAVAYVTINRRDHEYFPDTTCEVVWQPHQFSWTNDGRSDRMRNEEARRIAENIAEWVYDGKEEDPTNGALFYHTHHINPSWSRKVDEETQIGIHVFYTWDGSW